MGKIPDGFNRAFHFSGKEKGFSVEDIKFYYMDAKRVLFFQSGRELRMRVDV
ncbi:MAG: hypothetical protein H7839_01000 [Magnetococcus sp. YQC-5]